MKVFYHILILSLLMSCSSKNDLESIVERKQILPEIIIDSTDKIYSYGDIYIAYFYLSDSRFYQDIDNQGGTVIPMMTLNGERLLPKNGVGSVQFQVSDSLDFFYSNGKNYSYWNCSIMFPHPKGGDIIIKKRIDFKVSAPTSHEDVH